MAPIFIATMTTDTFTFDAAGVDEAQAKAALRAALKAHGKQYNLSTRWSLNYDIEVRRMVLGAGYRDHTQLSGEEQQA